MRIEKHPKLNIWVREDGCIYLPQSGSHSAHWTYGSKTHGYRAVRIGGKRYYVHRLVVEAFLGEIPKGCEIDHISRARDDNRLGNLRIVTSSENHRNTAAHDRVEAQGRTHKYEDERQFNRERQARYYSENKEKVLERQARHYAENKEKVCARQREQYAKQKALRLAAKEN